MGSAETNGVKSEKNRRNGVNNRSVLISTVVWSYTTGSKVVKLKADVRLLIEFLAVGSGLPGADNWISQRRLTFQVRIITCCSETQGRCNSPELFVVDCLDRVIQRIFRGRSRRFKLRTQRGTVLRGRGIAGTIHFLCLCSRWEGENERKGERGIRGSNTLCSKGRGRCRRMKKKKTKSERKYQQGKNTLSVNLMATDTLGSFFKTIASEKRGLIPSKEGEKQERMW